MILQIRTKDNLEELLKQGNSPAWVIAESRVPEIQSVEIYQFDGKRVLKAEFDAVSSTRTESDRLVVAFKNGVIEDADMDWNGQNPVRYQSENDLINNELSFEFTGKTIHEIAEIISDKMSQIVSRRDDAAAKQFSDELTNKIQKFPQYHWTLYFARTRRNAEALKADQNNQYDEVLAFCDHFHVNDIDEIVSGNVIDLDLNTLSEIDGLFNTTITVWFDKNRENVTFVDCLAEKFDFESSLSSLEYNDKVLFIHNSLLTFISINLKNISKNKDEITASNFAKILWLISETTLDGTSSSILNSIEFDPDSLRSASDSLTFFIQQFLKIDLESEFNSEINTDYVAYNGYRTDFLALSEEILSRELYDL